MAISGSLSVPDSPLQVSLNLKPYFCVLKIFFFISSSASHIFRQVGETAPSYIQTVVKSTKQKY